MFFRKTNKQPPQLESTKKEINIIQLKVDDEIIYRPQRAGLFQLHLTVGKTYTVLPGWIFARIVDDQNNSIAILREDYKHFQLVIDKTKNEPKLSKRSRKKYGKTKNQRRNKKRN